MREAKKYRTCLIISFRIESMLLAFFVLSFDICSWISFGVISFPKISSSDKFSVSSESFAKFVFSCFIDVIK